MKKLALLLLSLQCSLYNISTAQNPGDLDYNFAGGTVRMPGRHWLDVAVQPDGKLLTVGTVLARYNTNGFLDSTFGIGGVATIEVNDTAYSCNAIAIQPDGKVLVAGGAFNGSIDHDFLLVRFNADGSPDSTFDGDGVVRNDVNGWADDYGYELAIQPDGKIIVAGESDSKLALSRYHANGSLDSSFDYDGRLVVSSIDIITYVTISNQFRATYMKLQNDGKILVGNTDRVARLNADGSFDSSFGSGGIATIPHRMSDLVIQPDGKIVLAGGNGACFKIVRLEGNGSVDSSFAVFGTATVCKLQFSDPELMATSIALQPDGRILAGGYTMDGMLYDYNDFALIRLNSNGFVDNTFGTDGRVVTLFQGFEHMAKSYASAITPDLKLVLAGYENYASVCGFVAKYHLGGMQWPADANSIPGSNETFILAPNPTTSKLTITSGNKIKELSICNAMGQIAERQVLSGSERVTLDVAHLSPGIYYIKLTDETGSTHTGKFLKQ